MKTVAPQSPWRKWLKRLLCLAFIALVPVTIYLYPYRFWIGYLLATGPLGGATIVETDASCGDGEYRIVAYKYRSGDGYLALMNRAGKVFDSSTYSNGSDYGPFRWKKDCKKVMVSSDEGLTELEVK